ncbi:MAG: helix-turn-helix transcriptional regulator [Bacteroidales bacterium]|nr:helix-turn-helix transcriptional regulator [Bacteroidales bacterium]MCF8389695.1 helix-turn-helix transcriptional regulator [Bacteroidales bacterium]
MEYNTHLNEPIQLSPREKQVLELLARGLSCEEIGCQLCISAHTVIFHRNGLKQRLRAKNSCELIYYGCKLKII